MQPQDHPDDERLAALAASEPDAVDDRDLAVHVAGCALCGPMIDELRVLHDALAELPDLPPPRPLRFLPPVSEPAAARPRWLGLLRGLTMPAMAVAAVMILVGAIGSAGGVGSLGSAGAAPAASTTSKQDQGARAAGAPSATSSSESVDSVASSAPSVPTAFGGQASAPIPSNHQLSTRGESATPGLLQASTQPRPPFEGILGAGVVLLAAAFVARGYVRRRSLA